MITLAFGVPKMGKTQACMDYVGSHALTHRFLVVDRAGDWLLQNPQGEDRWRSVPFREWTARHARLWRMTRTAPGAEHMLLNQIKPWYGMAPSPDDGALVDWMDTLPPTGVFVFGYPWEGLEVADICRKLGNCTYVDDEIDEVATHVGWQQNPLRLFCHRGRHLPNEQGIVSEVHILGAARRAQSLHVDMTNLADQVFVFRVQGFRTLERLCDDRILEPSECDQARQQQPYHFKLWQSSGESAWGKLAPLK